MWRLAAWGGAAAFSLAVAVIVSQTGSGGKRLQLAFSGPAEPDDSAAPLITGSIPERSADVAAVKRMTDLTARKLAAVERNTAATRAATRRLALEVNKLTADSFRFSGRLANLEHQIDGIAGSIKQQAQEAAAAAVAKAMPPKPAHDSVFDKPGPAIGPPATTVPQLSLLMPPAPNSTPSPLTTDASKMKPDVATTASITGPGTKTKDQSKVASNLEGTVAPDAEHMAKAAPEPEELKAEVAVKMKAAPKGKQQIQMMEPAPGRIPMAKAEPPAAAMKDETKKMASVSKPTRQRVSRLWIPTHGYGIDLGGAESVTVAKAQWAAVKANFGPMLGRMRPLVVRNHRLLTAGDYRLVAGRTYSLKSARKLCDRLALQRVTCQPIEFDDGRMIWR